MPDTDLKLQMSKNGAFCRYRIGGDIPWIGPTADKPTIALELFLNGYLVYIRDVARHSTPIPAEAVALWKAQKISAEDMGRQIDQLLSKRTKIALSLFKATVADLLEQRVDATVGQVLMLMRFANEDIEHQLFDLQTYWIERR